MTLDDEQYYNCEVEADTGEKFKVFANTLHNKQLDQWHGYACAAGKHRLVIESDFTVYDGECKNTMLGNIMTDFTVRQEFATCNRQRCTGCTDDLLLEKREIKIISKELNNEY